MPIVEFDGPPLWFLDSRETGKTLSKKTVCYSEQTMSADKIIVYFRARWTVLFLYITIITRVTGDQISSPDAENKRGEQHTSADRGRLSLPNLAGFHGK